MPAENYSRHAKAKQSRSSYYLEGIEMTKIKASMAGTVWKIVVSEGEEVKAGQDVVILESMKMEIPISAESDGVVKRIIVQEGMFVNEEDDLLEIE